MGPSYSEIKNDQICESKEWLCFESKELFYHQMVIGVTCYTILCM